MQFTIAELTKGLDVTIQGDSHCLISGVCTIQQARPGFLTFLTNPHYRKYLATTDASAVILTAEDAVDCPANAIISRNPYYIYSQIAAFFEIKPSLQKGVHLSAVIGRDCVIDPSAVIAATCVLGDRVKIGANVIVGAGAVIGDDVEIGDDSQLDPNVTIYARVRMGKRARIMSGVVLGGDGFGFANNKGAWHKVPQLGTVVIGDDVDIGANTTVDRGAVGDTVIGNGVKLDNLIQVGHNTQIGDNTIIAGCVAIAGSTEIGRNCMIGGATCFAGHLSVADGVIVTGMTAVTKSITEPGMYSSGIVGAVPTQEFRKNNARFHRLENLMQRVKSLESALKSMTEGRDS
jgi:UDP-3-O-[3-hydroxymyristoyl] glucosamine N-acyltransferase